MKFVITLVFFTASFAISAKEIYECDFFGPNLFLTFYDNQDITLQNKMMYFQCKNGTVNYPGTEIELDVINCTSKNNQVTYFIVENNGNIILSGGLGVTKDIICKKL